MWVQLLHRAVIDGKPHANGPNKIKLGHYQIGARNVSLTRANCVRRETDFFSVANAARSWSAQQTLFHFAMNQLTTIGGRRQYRL